jgi:hypothetical protein
MPGLRLRGHLIHDNHYNRWHARNTYSEKCAHLCGVLLAAAAGSQQHGTESALRLGWVHVMRGGAPPLRLQCQPGPPATEGA